MKVIIIGILVLVLISIIGIKIKAHKREQLEKTRKLHEKK